MKTLIRSLIPESLINVYHFVLARLAQVVYGNPSNKLIVIGVTGTNGKSSTCQFIGQLLESLGHTVGWTTTAGFKIAGEEWQNKKKMTMLGRFQTQKMLNRMRAAGCTHVVIETSSQGVVQSRHVGVNYDVAIFTNLTPEHIESHGSFENYKQAKVDFFIHAANGTRKTINGLVIPKVGVVNSDDEHAEAFSLSTFDKLNPFGLSQLQSVEMTGQHTRFKLDGLSFELKPIGGFNLQNVFAAMRAIQGLGVSLEDLVEPVGALTSVPGRLESIDEGQDFSVIVDFAYEPAGFAALYNALKLIDHKRLIHIVSACGGGRDAEKRFTLGSMAIQHADIVIVTDEDPYDEDPMQIIEQIADGARKAGGEDGTNLFLIQDRREAIKKACEIAETGDLVVMTGKGNEPVMAVAGGKKIPWDDRKVTREILQSL